MLPARLSPPTSGVEKKATKKAEKVAQWREIRAANTEPPMVDDGAATTTTTVDDIIGSLGMENEMIEGIISEGAV